ncbi:hypothetical protein CYMTET_19672 [Cymbomonas tetramitiformis]|uniref:Uncharacterized protein n=1 Tax=Cymbomonas tetramitiformis TaxID=36881 RepID=A0AAE0G5I4_9CHLO|nr:hypothetical protein CYMTET_19672 [Cymbomonas tetramitiformis]
MVRCVAGVSSGTAEAGSALRDGVSSGTAGWSALRGDFPKCLQSGARVGFTSFPVWAAYSPVKNSPAEARAKVAAGTPSHSACAGELDIYNANCQVLRMLGADVAEAEEVTYNGLKLHQGPRVAWSPSFAVAFSQMEAKIVDAEQIHISLKSVLVLEGPDIKLESLNLDGSLVIKARSNPMARSPNWHFQHASA